MSVKTSPYGTWSSPISSRLISESSVSFLEVHVDWDTHCQDTVYWTECRFDEGGRCVVCSNKTGTDDVKSWTPKDFNARTTVHEKDSGTTLVNKGKVYFSNYKDQAIYRQDDSDEAPVRLTPEGSGCRFADGQFHNENNKIYCIREDHSLVNTGEAKEPTNTVVVVNPEDGTQNILAEGCDFYSCPRVSPNGKKIVWVQWNHPNMPWDSTALMVAELSEDGNSTIKGSEKQIAGGEDISVMLPSWTHDNELLYIGDQTDWWNLYHVTRSGDTEHLLPSGLEKRECGYHPGRFGQTPYMLDPRGNGDVVMVHGRELGIYNMTTKSYRKIETEFTYFQYVNFGANGMVFALAGSPTKGLCIIEIDTKSSELRRSGGKGGKCVNMADGQDEKDRMRGRGRYPEYKIKVGWLHYQKEKFRQVTAKKGGGARTYQYPKDIDQTADMLKEYAKKIFFPSGKNQMGSLADMDVHLSTHNGDIIEDFRDHNGEKCSLQEYLKVKVLRESKTLDVDKGYFSIPEELSWETSDKETTYGYYYPPTNKDYKAPEGTLPPLLVKIHGGPVGATYNVLSLAIQYFTSRGMAVLDVNYRGSTGYGKKYRHRLRNSWGILDVEDSCSGAEYLADSGRVNKDMLCIDGGSAGGYTTLAALTFKNVFKAGASHYGIGDLEAIAQETHKFESRYLDTLIGPYKTEKDKEVYKERSPINYVEKLNCPLALFQGDEDKIVPPNQAEMMYNAVKAKGIPTMFVMFKGEQHGFRKAENMQTALDGEFYFFSKVLGYDAADKHIDIPIDNL